MIFCRNISGWRHLQPENLLHSYYDIDCVLLRFTVCNATHLLGPVAYAEERDAVLGKAGGREGVDSGLTWGCILLFDG